VRILIVTSGSMGDVAPYTGLGARLIDAGHDVTLATHGHFRPAIRLPFHPLPGDLREIVPQARGQSGTDSGTGPRALARLMSLARPLVADLGQGIADAVTAVRPDVLLLSTVVAPLGYQVAEAFRLPWAGVFLQPVFPTRAFAPVLLGGRDLGPALNRLAGHAFTTSARTIYAGAIRDLRHTLGLPRVARRTLERDQLSRHPTFHGFSPTVLPRPADWPAALRVTGYWWPALPDWTPPAALTDFLASGPPPVFIGFGSMAPGQGERLAPIVLEAVRRAGVRAVLQAGWSGLAAAAPHDDVLSIGEAPHEWLFPRMSAVVHHAGAGTTAAALRAGRPAVPVPVLADQPFWAHRLHRLGAATKPLPLSALTAGRLAAALRAAPAYAPGAEALAGRLSTEDGAAPILAWLTQQL
jgi:UDP:flavonoid glycosyltransferase YjiC (YdhE family)